MNRMGKKGFQMMLLSIAIGVLALADIVQSATNTALSCKGASVPEGGVANIVITRTGDIRYAIEILCFTKKNALSTALSEAHYKETNEIISITNTSQFSVQTREDRDMTAKRTFSTSCVYYTFYNPSYTSLVNMSSDCEETQSTIINNDSELELCADSPSQVMENAGVLELKFCRTGDLSFASDVSYSITGDSDASPSIAASSSSSFSISPGQSKVSVDIAIRDDKKGETENQIIKFTLKSTSNYRLIFGSKNKISTITLKDDDNEFYFNNKDGVFSEGDGPLKVFISRKGALSTNAKVRVLFNSSAFCAGTDNPEITFSPNEAKKEVTICNIVDDDILNVKQNVISIELQGMGGSVVSIDKKDMSIEIKDNEAMVTCEDVAVYESSGKLTFILKRQGNLKFTSYVECKTSNGTAKSGIDYNPQAKTLRLQATSSEAKTSIDILDNDIVQPNRTFLMRCSRASLDIQTIIDSSCLSTTLTIIDDDVYVFFCHEHPKYINESFGPYEVSLCREGLMSHSVSVKLCQSSDSDSSSPRDFPSITQGCQNVLFGEEEKRKTVSFPVNDDKWGEKEFKQFSIYLASLGPARQRRSIQIPAKVKFNGTSRFQVTIHDNDNSFCGIQSSKYYEHDAEYINVTITRSGQISVTNASVRVQIHSNSAQSPQDYEASFSNKTFTFLVNETKKVETIKINDDKEAESNETLTIKLIGLGPSTIFPGCDASLVIISDDVDVTCPGSGGKQAFGSQSKLESASSFTVTFQRSGDLHNNHTIRIETIADTAKPGEDFKPINKTLTFYDNQASVQETVQIIDDYIVEREETFSLKVTSSDDRVNVRCPGFDFTIKDDDTLIYCVNKTIHASEGSKQVSFGVKREGILSQNSTFWFTHMDGTAFDKADFKPNIKIRLCLIAELKIIVT